MGHRYILWFDEVGLDDIAQVGGKNASLGEMTRTLTAAGVRVPDGFATTAAAYRSFLAANGLEPRLGALLEELRAGRAGLQSTGAALRHLILASTLPEALAGALREAYRTLAVRTGADLPAVAVRSSATAEDLPNASFAGQQETYLNITGEEDLLQACLHCYASLFTDRAISYRQAQGFGHLDVALSVGVQRMVRSDVGASGVMFSIDPDTGFPRTVVVSAAWGLGETVVKGSVDPDRYTVFKPLLARPEAAPIIGAAVGGKERKMVLAEDGSTITVATSPEERRARVLDEPEVLHLARWALAVEEHYGRPMDLEWAKDGATGELFMVQARPETVQARRSGDRFTVHHLTGKGLLLLTGSAVGESIAVGGVCLVRSPADLADFRDGAILVTEMTDPDWVPVMRRAAGIVTDHGGPTSHAAIVSRELGVPAVVGTGNATAALADGDTITLSCAEGERGRIYAGALAFETEDVDLGALPHPRTDVMVNIADPSAAFRWWRLPAAGVGLARMEFIIGNLIKAHPMALVHPERVRDAEALRRIGELAAGFADPREYFVHTLAQGIARLAAPYHPGPAIVRLSDFKSNEYAHLLGGEGFERPEENPMLGFRGASRYYDERYRAGFELECRALVRVREHLGFTNVVVMVPFCRTPGEADKVLEVMAANGLERGRNGLQVYVMCEIPSNVVLAEEFAKRFDGFSIGSNDLTQLVLGVDRDAADLAALFDERDPAVTAMIAEAIRKAHAAGIRIGICGQGPSNHPDFAAFLVREGIDSISLNPDSFLRTVRTIAAAEAEASGREAPGREAPGR